MRNVLAIVVAALLVSPSVRAEEKLLYSSSSLTNAAAYRAARAALDLCVSKGYLATVTVSDRAGMPLVVLRDKLAGFHTLEVSAAKARTAASFRTATTSLAAATVAGKPESGIRHAGGVMVIGGGIPIEAGGKLVRDIGVSGALGGDADDECAMAGIEAVKDDLEFASQ